MYFQSNDMVGIIYGAQIGTTDCSSKESWKEAGRYGKEAGGYGSTILVSNSTHQIVEELNEWMVATDDVQ